MPDIKELQTKRLELHSLIKAHADKQDAWNAEDRAKWTELNAAYDANLALLTAERTKVESEEKQRTEIQVRLAGMDGYKDWVPGGARPPIGRDGASLHGDGPTNPNRFSSDPTEISAFRKRQATAMQGWMLASRFPGDVRDEHIEAAKACGIHLGASEIVIRGYDNEQFQQVKEYWRYGTCSRNGKDLNAARYRNDLQTGQVGLGGALVGETLLARLEEAQLSYSGVLQVAEVIRTNNGETMRWPTMDDTANIGSRVGETQQVVPNFGTSVDPKIGRLSLQAFTYNSGFLNVSRSFMTDSVINLEAKFGEMMGVRIGRKQNVDFTTGADVGDGPIGIVTAAVLGNTSVSSSAIIFDEVIDLLHTVDPAYRNQPGVGYMFHDGILQVLRKLKDGIGRYLWQSGTVAALPDTINDKPYWINQAMASTVTNSAIVMLFGKLDLYKVRQVNEIRIQRLIQRRAEFDEDVFIAYLRADGGLLDPGQSTATHPVKYYQMHS